MKFNQRLTLLILGLGIHSAAISQCEINASALPTQIYCGQSSVLTAYGSGSGTVVMDENFNSGFGSGWSSTPGATSFSNPCSPGGADGTPHAWMDANTSVPRTLTSTGYNLTSATAGVTICFDLLFAEQGGNAPCEGPDESDEGVYFQYSVNGGATWIDIHYFDPNGGYDPQLINWSNWCFQIPAAAITSNTMFRWHQTADSGAGYDHWGIDNVQIVQNDVNAEIVWQHDGYSYGAGSSGGTNPTPVTPTTTTTYNVQITTGTGAVCSTSVTVTVIDPVYEIDLETDPAILCSGDCADIVGTAVQVIDPGGPHTYENAEVSALTGLPSINDLISLLAPCFNFSGCNCLDGSTVAFGQTCPAIFDATIAMNINITDLNAVQVSDGEITSICITGADMAMGNFSDFEIRLKCPDGTSILLANQGDVVGTQISNMCFSMTGTDPVSSGTAPYSGTWLPAEPLTNLNGCSANGVWTIEFSATYDWSSGAPSNMPLGTLYGWTFNYDDPPIHAPVTASWSPSAGLSDPNIINPEVCATSSTSYVVTVSNGTPGCATYQETIPITVDACNGCVNPNVVINPLSACAPATVNLANAINASSDPATLSYHASQTDAQNDASPISTTVSSSGTYWVRAENPTADTCFTVHQITVTIAAEEDASFSLTDFCAGTANAATNIAVTGGTFAFNPSPTDGATINASTGQITNGVAGTTYSVEYTTGGTCPGTNVETVFVNANPTPTISGNLTYCAGGSSTLNAGSGYANYSWTPIGGATQTVTTTAATGITVTVTDANGCIGTSAPVNVAESNLIENVSSVLICPGASVVVHGNTVTAAGTYADTFAISGGCDSVSIVTVAYHPVVVPTITGDLWYCSGGAATLSVSPQNFTSYSWSTGGSQSTISTTSSQPITVTVVDANGCSTTSTPVVLVQPPLAVLYATPTTGTAPVSVEFSNGSSNATSYDWYIVGVDTFSTVNWSDDYSHVYQNEGVYTAVLVAHSAHCSDTAIVYINALGVDQPLDTYIPNVFTPNGDGANDFFTFNTLNAEELELVIVNRWGNVVYKTDKVNFMWDGKDMSGRPVTEGVYFFDYKIKGLMGDERIGHGFVTVER
jgi:gliding motility-associated-like protein